MIPMEKVVVPAAPSEGFSRTQDSMPPSQRTGSLFGKRSVGENIQKVARDEEGIVRRGLVEKPEELGPVAVEIGGQEEAHGVAITAMRLI
jgi:hypothetical protein